MKISLSTLSNRLGNFSKDLPKSVKKNSTTTIINVYFPEKHNILICSGRIAVARRRTEVVGWFHGGSFRG